MGKGVIFWKNGNFKGQLSHAPFFKISNFTSGSSTASIFVYVIRINIIHDIFASEYTLIFPFYRHFIKQAKTSKGPFWPKYLISRKNNLGGQFDHKTKWNNKKRENFTTPTVGPAWFLQKVALKVVVHLCDILPYFTEYARFSSSSLLYDHKV